MGDMAFPMRVDLEGKVAVVTGGGTGIGQAISRGLARCGAAVVVGYRESAAEAAATVAAIEADGGRASAGTADVGDEAQVAALMGSAVERYGGLDILVANAGVTATPRTTAELPGEEWDAIIRTNCTGVFYSVKHALRHLPDDGRIIVTSSISARSGAGPGALSYAAAKGAVNNMIRNWTRELAPRGITVNAIAPGIIWTRIHQRGTPPDEYRKLIERVPLGRDGTPEDCVGAVLLLASGDGSYITGQTIEINGGMQMP